MINHRCNNEHCALVFQPLTPDAFTRFVLKIILTNLD